MSGLPTAVKRVLVGRPFRTDSIGSTLLPKRIALPVFASDALSSVAYAPEEIFLVLSAAGLSAVAFSPLVGLGVALVMIVVVASYRQNVHAYPSGGGDYEVATKNIGATAGLLVGSALLVEYTLTVAVSISSAVSNVGSVIPLVGGHKVVFAVLVIGLLAAVNLRGARESGLISALPTYAFLLAMTSMLGWGFFQILVLGRDLRAESSSFELHAGDGEITGIALAFILARAFSSGCAALTGVESVSNGVPAFRKPKSRNAATTLAVLGGISIVFLLGLITLARLVGVRLAEDPATQLLGAPGDYHQKTLVAQLSGAVFAGFPIGGWLVTIFTALILVLAANTAFNSFPVLGSVLAHDKWLPRQLHTRGDRLAFSNGIIMLAVIAIGFVIAFDATVTGLVQLYVLGVFVSFTLGQFGMVRHWNRHLEFERDGKTRARMRRSRAINAVGLASTGFVLGVVIVTKFTAGVWITLVMMAAFFVLMRLVRMHYDSVEAEIMAAEWEGILPSRIHVVVLVSKLHLPTRRALAFARAAQPDTLEAVTVNVDDAVTRRLVGEWEKADLGVPLKVIEAPYREITRPVLAYVGRVHAHSPRDIVNVYIPEYVVGRWWERMLHNQSAKRLKTRLLFQRNVVVTSVPWQLASADLVNAADLMRTPGASRRGFETRGTDGR